MVPEAVALYTGAAVKVRARAWARWVGTPFAGIEGKVPRQGRVLEVGCGIGVFACHLALAGKGRDVLGVDENLDDIVQCHFAARKARMAGSRVDFQLTPPGDVPDGPWDAVVLVDVLSRLDPDAQAGLINTCAEQLALGGALVVKDVAAAGPVARARGWVDRSRGREDLGGGGTPPDPATLEHWMDEAGLVVSHEEIERQYRPPHHLFVGSRRRSVA